MHQSTVRVDGTPGAGPTADEISQLRDQSAPHPEPQVTSAVETTKAGVFTLRRKTCSLMGVQIVGTGSYVPENVVTVVGHDLAYTVDLEHMTRHAGDQPVPRTLRCTQVYRRENGAWKVILRHADELPGKDAQQR